MIDRMKKVTVFTESRRKHQLLISLRELGVMHISDMVQRSENSEILSKRKSEYSRVLLAIEERAGKTAKTAKQLDADSGEFDSIHESLLEALEEEKRLQDKLIQLRSEKERILPFGDFDPKGIEELGKYDIRLNFYTLTAKDANKLALRDDVAFIRVSYSGKLQAIAVIGDEILPLDTGASYFEMPNKSLGEIESEILISVERLKALSDKFLAAASYISSYKKRIEEEEEDIIFEKASSSVLNDDEIIYLSGYIPEEEADKFRAFCKENTYAYLLDDPSDEDAPPTKVKYKGLVRIIKPLFDMLGTIPGYREYDTSLPFLCFFALFFAMIIGDAGYGFIFLLAAVGMNVKSKKASDVNILLYVLSLATIFWGAITGTWFGSEYILTHVPGLKSLVIPSITNFPEVFGVSSTFTQNMVMKFCFMLGSVQLVLACIINIIHKIKTKNLGFIADIGWMVDYLVLYLLVLYLVIGESVPFKPIVAGVASGFIMVCLFGGFETGMPIGKGIKASLGGAFTNFLNTISCFSNIMSYIRLFAVGMASVAIAQSFNDMASPLLHGFALPAGILIVVLGHAINLVMGLLSVVVHGVRLNLLEFSNQLGMEWSGYNYDPFRCRIADGNNVKNN